MARLRKDYIAMKVRAAHYAGHYTSIPYRRNMCPYCGHLYHYVRYTSNQGQYKCQRLHCRRCKNDWFELYVPGLQYQPLVRIGKELLDVEAA